MIHKPPRRNKPQMTLDRVLSRFGVASRSNAAEMIRAGRVTVNGRRVTDPLVWIEPRIETVRVDGQRLRRAPSVYYAMHKPKGVITSRGDPQGRKTVYDVLEVTLGEKRQGKGDNRTGASAGQCGAVKGKPIKWLFPVGRLDYDTSGLLLFTNDSVFAERITSPLTKVAKTYLVKVNAILNEDELARLRAGVDIGRGETSGPAKVSFLRDNGRFCWLEIEITEGKNRQLRRMIEALGYKVLKLVRTQIGKLILGDLPVGSIRAIKPSNVI
jgi:pseudouridine synthase